VNPAPSKIQYVKGVECSDIKRRRGLKQMNPASLKRRGMNNKEGAG